MMQHLRQLISRRHGRKIDAAPRPHRSSNHPCKTDLSASAATAHSDTFYPIMGNRRDNDPTALSNDLVTHLGLCLHGVPTPKRLRHVQALLENPTVDTNAAWDTLLDFMASQSFPTFPPLLTSASDLTVGKWQWRRYLAESQLDSRQQLFTATSPVRTALRASSPSTKLLLELPYDIAYRLQSYLDATSLGRIRQTCWQMSAFPVDLYSERKWVYAWTHPEWQTSSEQVHSKDSKRHTIAPGRSSCIPLRAMVEAVRCLDVPLALHLLQESQASVSSNQRFWYSWALFLAVHHTTSALSHAQQKAVGQVLRALLLHPCLPTIAWFMVVPAFSHVQQCLLAAAMDPPPQLQNQLSQGLYQLLLGSSSAVPDQLAALSIETRLFIGLNVLSNYPARITALHETLTQPPIARTEFQRSTVDHWLFLFSVQSGQVALVRYVLRLVQPQALALQVALGYAKGMMGNGWHEVRQELESVLADGGWGR